MILFSCFQSLLQQKDKIPTFSQSDEAEVTINKCVFQNSFLGCPWSAGCLWKLGSIYFSKTKPDPR